MSGDRFENWIDENPSENFISIIWTVQGHYPYFISKKEEDFGVNNFNYNRYLNALKSNDDLIGNIMKSLEERGLDESTLVIVTGDHGEAFGQHNQFGHASTIYDENLKVPLYFINPILFNGEIKTDIASTKDLAPTALSLLGVESPKEWQGRNLLTTDSNEVFFFAP